MDKPANAVGRPTVVTPEVLAKLDSAFSIGCSDREACLYADISQAALYNYQNAHPEYVEYKEMLKEKPLLKARQTVVKALDDPNDAKWYLERKRKGEFAQRTETTGADGEPFKVQVVQYKLADANKPQIISPAYIPETQGQPGVESKEATEPLTVAGEQSGAVRTIEEGVPPTPETGSAS